MHIKRFKEYRPDSLACATGLYLQSLLAVLFVCAAESPVLAADAARWPFEAQIGQFAIHSDFEVASNPNFVKQFGTLKADIESTLKIRIQDEAVHLILFKRQSNYRGYMRRYFPTVPTRRALFIKRRGPGMVFAYESNEMHIDVRHETTHALLNASLPYVPLWLDEGLAEYFESTPSGNTRSHPHHSSTRRQAQWGRVPTLESLEAIGDLSDMGTTEYQQAWSWVHFLLHESDESRSVLIRFLQDLQAHAPPGQLSRRVASELPEWQSRYLRHFRR